MSTNYGNVEQFVLVLMAAKGLDTQEQVAEFIGISPAQISKWKLKDQVPKKYLAKYQYLINAMDTNDNPNIISEEMSMYPTAEHYVFIDPKSGQLKRVNKETCNVEIHIAGEWVSAKAP